MVLAPKGSGGLAVLMFLMLKPLFLLDVESAVKSLKPTIYLALFHFLVSCGLNQQNDKSFSSGSVTTVGASEKQQDTADAKSEGKQRAKRVAKTRDEKENGPLGDSNGVNQKGEPSQNEKDAATSDGEELAADTDGDEAEAAEEAAEAPPVDPFKVTYVIGQDYTGAGDINSAANPIQVKVYPGAKKQELVITNMSDQVFRLHTGGAPCGHAPTSGAIAKGESYTCVIQSPLAVAPDATRSRTYDHNAGDTTGLYINAVNAPDPAEMQP